MAKQDRKRAAKVMRPARTASAKASERFLSDLKARGESAKLTRQGKLPLRATHIEQENPDGTVEVRRARFKTW